MGACVLKIILLGPLKMYIYCKVLKNWDALNIGKIICFDGPNIWHILEITQKSVIFFTKELGQCLSASYFLF